MAVRLADSDKYMVSDEPRTYYSSYQCWENVPFLYSGCNRKVRSIQISTHYGKHVRYFSDLDELSR
jgi:hypothetical protein